MVPLLALKPFDDPRQAIQELTQTRYGFLAAFFGSPPEEAPSLLRTHFGMVYDNPDFFFTPLRLPFGGKKDSGWILERIGDRWVERDGAFQYSTRIGTSRSLIQQLANVEEMEHGTFELQGIRRIYQQQSRLRTFPMAVKFLKDKNEFPAKTRQPSVVFRKKVTICQGVTMARVYGWTVGLTRDDLICVPAIIAFGLSGAADPAESLVDLFCELDFAKDKEGAENTRSAPSSRLENGEYQAMVLAPLEKGLFEPDTIVLYGNPAQVMRMVQALVYEEKRRIQGNFGGKVECSEYLHRTLQDPIAPSDHSRDGGSHFLHDPR